MMRRTFMLGLAVGLAIVAGCGSQPGVTEAAPTTTQPEAAGPLLLAQFDRGVGAVSPESGTPVWTDRNAAAALDGSAVFSIRQAVSLSSSNGTAGGELLQIDPDTGATLSAWPLPTAMASISAVSPGGRWVALTDRGPGYDASEPRPSTRLVVFDSTSGAETRRLDLDGDVRPEAFSVNGKLLFVLDYRGDHYTVETLILATSERYETSARDKSAEAEKMNGTTVRGVLNADKTLLATLYRNTGDAEEPAFVHILDLQNGWAYCADLVAPFGSGPEGSDRIELTPAGTALVTTSAASRTAEIHISEVHEPSDRPVTIEYRDGAVTPSDAAFVSTPGFGHVIATLG
jgi:hypothetical protein